MALSKKKRTIILFIILVLLVSASIVSVSIMLARYSERARRFSVTEEALEYVYNQSYEFDDLKDVSDLIPDNLYLIDEEFQDLDFPFSFIINKEGIKITGVLNAQFYDLELEIGDLITQIDDKDLKELDYFEIVKLLYDEEEHILKTENKEIIFLRADMDSRIDYKVSGQEIQVNLKDLSNIRASALYKLVKDYQNIVLDLSKASINDLETLTQYLSLFKEGVLFQKNEEQINSQSLVRFDKNNILIKVGSNLNEGVLFFASLLNSYKLSNVTFDDVVIMKEASFNQVFLSNHFIIFISSIKAKEVSYESSSGQEV